MVDLFEFLEKYSVENLQNATLHLKKNIIKITLRKLSTPSARRKYLTQLGIRFDDKTQLFSANDGIGRLTGGVLVPPSWRRQSSSSAPPTITDLELKSLLCPITKLIFIEPVIAENGVTYEKSALLSQFKKKTFTLGLTRCPVLEELSQTFGVNSSDRLNLVPNDIMRHNIFRFKLEIVDMHDNSFLIRDKTATNRKIRLFFQRYWNNILAKKLGYSTYVNPWARLYYVDKEYENKFFKNQVIDQSVRTMIKSIPLFLADPKLSAYINASILLFRVVSHGHEQPVGWLTGNVGELYGTKPRSQDIKKSLDSMLATKARKKNLKFLYYLSQQIVAIIILYYIYFPAMMMTYDFVDIFMKEFLKKRENRAKLSSRISRAYDVLNVSRGVTLSELKKAFHKQALKHHPDKGGDIEEFKKIQAAYDMLKMYVRL